MEDGKESGVGASPSRERKSQGRLTRRLTDELRHRADLAMFSDGMATRWTDALLAETRFHLAGTMNAVEMAIRLEISDRDLDARLGALEQPYCSLALERQMDLLSPELLSHFRLRGALSAVRRGRTDVGRPHDENEALASAGEAFDQALSALSLAEQHWSGPLLLDTPMRPDLPAELFCDLAWTSAALLIRGSSELRGGNDREDMHLVIQAVERVIARHDEGVGPFALAQRAARTLTSEERMRIAPAALIERRLLLFCALVEAETALPIANVVGALVDGGDEARQAILKLMAIDESLAVHVFEMLAPLTGGSGEHDLALAHFVEGYRTFGMHDGEAWLSRMLMPPALVSKLTMIDPSA